MAHWRSMFTSAEFMTAADLYDAKSDSFRELTATISRIEQVILTGKKGKKDGRPGVWFKESKSGKPLGLNATNSAAIENVTGSSDMKNWIGARVTLRVEMVNIRGEGIRPAIRIAPFAPGQQRAARGGEPTDPAPIDADEAQQIADAERKEHGR